VRFYDAGVEIKNYDVVELVDFPSQMRFTTSDWHFDWLGDRPCELVENHFILYTSTHDMFRFDIRTGAIVSQMRWWRWVLQISTTLLSVVILFGCGWLVVRYRRGTP
jgi:hypothetical protein